MTGSASDPRAAMPNASDLASQPSPTHAGIGALADRLAAQSIDSGSAPGAQMSTQRVGELPSQAPPAGHRRYLAFFVHRYLDFRCPELEAVAAMTSSGPVVWGEPHGGPLSPFWPVWLPDDAAACRIASRALLLRRILEVWGEGDTLEEMHKSVRAGLGSRDASYPADDASWKINVENWGGSAGDDMQRRELMEGMAFTGFRGPVQLKDPQHTFWLISVGREASPGLPDMPERWYFAREVAAADRQSMHQYHLTKRRYLGPTSMDHELAFIMCNQGLVRRGSLVFDPFVGTGSMLVAAAHYGAHVMGADIDMRVIRLGKSDKAGQPVDLWTNFQDYNLPPPVGLLRADAHTMPWRAGLESVFDAMLADPPYGVRAGARKSMHKDYVPRPNNGRPHFPSTAPYTLTECLRDLLDSAARLLRMGGRLVYFLPSVPELYDESQLPTHPMLRIIANSEQLLTSRYSRRLLTMQKVAEYDAAIAAAHHTANPGLLSFEQVHDRVYEQRLGSDGKPQSDGDGRHPRNRGKQL